MGEKKKLILDYSFIEQFDTKQDVLSPSPSQDELKSLYKSEFESLLKEWKSECITKYKMELEESYAQKLQEKIDSLDKEHNGKLSELDKCICSLSQGITKIETYLLRGEELLKPAAVALALSGIYKLVGTSENYKVILQELISANVNRLRVKTEPVCLSISSLDKEHLLSSLSSLECAEIKVEPSLRQGEVLLEINDQIFDISILNQVDLIRNALIDELVNDGFKVR